jgi:hypothetical protein
MPNYTKLFSSIVTSTIWTEDDKTRILWITMLAICDQHGEVHASIPGLARIAGLSVEDCETAIRKFLAPDVYSRTKDFEGRRISEISGGWELLNHAKYRRMASKIDHDESNAARQARHRERVANSNAPVTHSNAPVTHSNAPVTHSNAPVTDEMDKQKQDPDTHSKAKAKSTERPSGYAVPACFETIEGFSAALAGWIEMRKAKKNPPTGTAIQIVIDRLAERPRDAVAALRLGIERGWTGMKWEWFDNERGRPSSGGLHENELHEKIKSKIRTYGTTDAASH